MTEIFRPTFHPADRQSFMGHWTDEEVANTGATWQCIASFLAYLDRVGGTDPKDADKAKVTDYIKERLAEDPAYDLWAIG